ncbi:MAG TPA: CBS domain-containing protein [Chloroflexota bacterium]|nr:CBS domain-containing protein [Chloroflexota bacterium]
MRVGEVMSRPAIVVPLDAPVQHVARQMVGSQAPAVAVIDAQGALRGIVSESDLIVRNAKLHFPTYLGILESLIPIGGDRDLDDELRRLLGATAGEIMTSDPYTAAPGDDLGEVVHEMLHKGYHAVPVVERQHVVGMLFPSDVVKIIARDEN